MADVGAALSPQPSITDALQGSSAKLDTMIDKSEAKSDQLWQSGQEAAKASEESRKKISDLKPPEMPKLQPVPKFEAPQDPMRGYVSSIGVLGAIGSLFTRRPWTNSMNAAAATINAWKQGDADTAKKQFEVWKAETDNAFKMHDYEMETYKTLLDKYADDPKEAIASVQAQAAAFKNDGMLLMAQNHQIDKMYSYISASNKTAERAQEHVPVFEKQQAEAEMAMVSAGALKQRVEDFKTQNNGANPPPQLLTQWAAEAKGKSGSSSTPTLKKETINELAEQIIAGDRTALSNMGRNAGGAANVAAIRDRVAELAKEKGMDGADVASRFAEFQGFAAEERSVGQREAAITVAATEAKKVSPLALKASDAFGRGEWMPVNAAEQMVAKGTGDKKIVQFTAANNALINVYARAISPTGQPTVSDKNHAREVLSTAQSKEQYRATVEQMNKEIDAALSSPKTVRESLRNRNKDVSDVPPSGFSKDDWKEAIKELRLNPETRDQFDEHFGAGEAEKIIGDK